MNFRHLLATCLVVLLGWVVEPATAADPDHLPIGSQRLQVRTLPVAPRGAPRPVNPQATSNMLFEDDDPLGSFDLDRSLSKLCREGRFRQQQERLFTVRLGGYVHGVVIGQYWGLYDPEGRAVANLVYALRWQDTARCEVYVLRHLQD